MIFKSTLRFKPEDLHLNGPRNLSCLWNAMIFPFLNMTIYGSIWYQGEENAERPLYDYNCTFPAMIDDWRSKWYESTQHNTDATFPFGFVQVRISWKFRYCVNSVENIPSKVSFP